MHAKYKIPSHVKYINERCTQSVNDICTLNPICVLNIDFLRLK